MIVSGPQDAVVETLGELGMTLDNIRTVLDLDDALVLSREERPKGAIEFDLFDPPEETDEDEDVSL